MLTLDQLIYLQNNTTHQAIITLLRDELQRSVPNFKIIQACREYLKYEYNNLKNNA